MQNRPNREIHSSEEINAIIENGKFVTIAMCNDSEPYIVTLSYGFDKENNVLYFHSAKEGLKIIFILKNPSVCATIIEDGGYIADECAHVYKSVILWGNMHLVDDLEEKKHGMLTLLNHLEEKPAIRKEMMLKSDKTYSSMNIIRFDIHQVQGKAGR
jgi:nitroimidazol reductase NimA-like FMN-containing flavoprotein (pyridoxamine 5'-phosphate oxidase superfamily)